MIWKVSKNYRSQKLLHVQNCLTTTPTTTTNTPTKEISIPQAPVLRKFINNIQKLYISVFPFSWKGKYWFYTHDISILIGTKWNILLYSLPTPQARKLTIIIMKNMYLLTHVEKYFLCYFNLSRKWLIPVRVWGINLTSYICTFSYNRNLEIKR